MRLSHFGTKYSSICTFIIMVLLTSCKVKKNVVIGKVDTSLSTRKIIQKHYSNSLDFETLSGRVKIDYEDGDVNQGITVSLRIKKDEAIWVSAPFDHFPTI